MLSPEQITELCICNRSDLIDPINTYWSKISKWKKFRIYRPCHWVSSDISEKDFIDHCIKIIVLD